MYQKKPVNIYLKKNQTHTVVDNISILLYFGLGNTYRID